MRTEQPKRWRHLPAWLLALSLSACGSNAGTPPAAPATEAPRITVWKSPSCGCCGKWVDHLEAEGFAVTVVDERAMAPLKSSLDIPPELQSCHTAKVDGYLVEGHVPAGDIRRLLAERPDARGIAVPGMPAGSPGMEVAGRFDAFDVMLFGTEGEPAVYAHHAAPSWDAP